MKKLDYLGKNLYEKQLMLNLKALIYILMMTLLRHIYQNISVSTMKILEFKENKFI